MKTYLIKLGFMLVPFYKIKRLFQQVLDCVFTGVLCRLINVLDVGNFSAERPVYIAGGGKITIHSGHIRMFTRISAIQNYHGIDYAPEIKIGKNVNIGINNHIGAINSIIIGDNFLSGANCLITDHSHGGTDADVIGMPPDDRILTSKGPVKIGNNVHIGENVIILPGVNIGNNVIVGAGSVVTKSIPDNTLACGNPAKVIKNIQ